jgi:hypothetical protein
VVGGPGEGGAEVRMASRRGSRESGSGRVIGPRDGVAVLPILRRSEMGRRRRQSLQSISARRENCLDVAVVTEDVELTSSYNDMLESELGSEVENGRLVRLMTKLGFINERAE